ncbi:hypothetical protein HDU98_011316 [Podochytrium sp. JEL0797]|nr:hypothetical protein HDU98_011316 [Podochytrium sp. JEL0797]
MTTKGEKEPAPPVFFSYGVFAAHRTRIAVVWMVLRGMAVGAVTLALLLRLSDGVMQRGIHTAAPCTESLSAGHWSPKSNWLTDACATNKYPVSEATKCLGNSKVIMIGDSSMRAVYYALRTKLGAKASDFALESGKKHVDLSATVGGVVLDFYWDPWLNRTEVLEKLQEGHSKSSLSTVSVTGETKPHTSLAMVSAGAWFMRYGGEQGAAVERFGNTMTKIRDVVNTRAKKGGLADNFIARLLPPFDESKLSEERKLYLHNELRHQYNHKLFQLVPEGQTTQSSAFRLGTVGLHVLTAADGMTTDGLHYVPKVDNTEVELLLNEICNKDIYAGIKQQGRASCCVDYPDTPAGVMAILVLVLIFGPGMFYLRTSKPDYEPTQPYLALFYPSEKTAFAIGVLGFVLATCLTMDRTNLFVKVNKEFSTIEFVLLNICWIVPGLWSLRVGKDSTFLNRDQTDEWKGWMQFAILVYHYTGGSKIIPIYAVIRVMVASYLFMTGFGHFTFFFKKADFGFLRLARVLVRLNLLSIALSYVMQTDTLFYYFGPLVSFWFLIVYATMGIYSAGNSNPTILVSKLALSNFIAYAFTHFPFIYTPFFNLCENLFAVRWNAKEAAFRLALDQYAVHFGMLCAYLMISLKTAESGATPGTYNWLNAISTSIVNRWSQIKTYAVISSGVVLLAYTLFLSTVTITKSQNNAYHPYISLIILGAFVILRNTTEPLRKTTSVFWRWIGGFSLETFILQYHMWLAVDTYGLLDLLGPGVTGRGSGEMGVVVKWFGFFMSTVAFLGVSEVLGEVSGPLVEAVVVGGGNAKEWRWVVGRCVGWCLVLVVWNLVVVV